VRKVSNSPLTKPKIVETTKIRPIFPNDPIVSARPAPPKTASASRPSSSMTPLSRADATRMATIANTTARDIPQTNVIAWNNNRGN